MPSPLAVPRRARPRLAVAALAASLAAVVACRASLSSGPEDSGLGRVCTLVGCESALTVRLSSAPAGAWRVEVTDLATGATRAFDCPATAQCGPQVVLSDFTPERARVRVTSAAGTRDTEVRPTYAEARPNGPDCPPVCRQGSVEVAVG